MEGDITWVEGLRFAGSLAIVIGLIVGLRWLLDRMDGRAGVWFTPKTDSAAEAPEILSRRMIDARHTLVVIRWHGADHLVVLGPQGQIVIDRRNQPGSL